MQTFYKICLLLLIVGGVNWGLVGLFQFDLVGWLLGGSTKHPNFKYTADADDKNAFDIEAFLSARLKLKPNEVCDVYEVDTKGA